MKQVLLLIVLLAMSGCYSAQRKPSVVDLTNPIGEQSLHNRAKVESKYPKSNVINFTTGGNKQ
jgi:hypothetical protein